MNEELVGSENSSSNLNGDSLQLGVRSLRKGRALALQILYEADVTTHDWEISLEYHASLRNYATPITEYAKRMIDGVLQDIATLDAEIERFAPNYPVQQLSVVDRNVLRLALYEIRNDAHTPLKVIINEAVEIAKTYGSEASYKFVNGVLGSLLEDKHNTQKYK